MVLTSLSLLDRLRSSPVGSAWKRLIGIYRRWIVGWAVRHGLSVSDAYDLAQEVLVVVLRELPHFQHICRQGAFRAWLRTITVHRLQDFLRSQDYQPEAGGDTDFLERLNQLQDPADESSREWDREHDRYVGCREPASFGADAITRRAWCKFRSLTSRPSPCQNRTPDFRPQHQLGLRWSIHQRR